MLKQEESARKANGQAERKCFTNTTNPSTDSAYTDFGNFTKYPGRQTEMKNHDFSNNGQIL